MMSTSLPDDPAVLVPAAPLLPEELSIFSAADLLSTLRTLLANAAAGPDAPDTLRLDATRVAEVDAAGVQLLLSLSNSLLRQGRQLQIEPASAALRQACQRLGAAWLLAPDSLRESTP
jgi:ABC-type transporter Mla MlaB component